MKPPAVAVSSTKCGIVLRWSGEMNGGVPIHGGVKGAQQNWEEKGGQLGLLGGPFWDHQCF